MKAAAQESTLQSETLIDAHHHEEAHTKECSVSTSEVCAQESASLLDTNASVIDDSFDLTLCYQSLELVATCRIRVEH